MQNVWDYVIGAYVVAGVGLGGLTLAIVLQLRHWAARAREEAQR